MQLSNEILTLVVVALAATTLVLLIALIAVSLKLRRLSRAYASAVDSSNGEDLFEAIERHVREVESLREDVVVVHRNTERLREMLRASVSQVGVVRYDAFDDMGGALSFSAALLDEHGDGVVISAINGRTEGRTYAKPVSGGTSDFHLSPEELEAIEAAASGEKGVSVEASPRRRRRRAAS